MKKRLLFLLALPFGLAVNSATAAVTPPGTPVVPEVSTESAEHWYVMMSSHMSDSDRQNRFMYVQKADDESLTILTEQYNNGMSESDITNYYIWKLESANDGTATHVYLVNCATKKRIAVPSTATAASNTQLLLDDTGAVWDYKLSSSTGQSDCAANQYCFDLTSYSTPAYLNAMPGGNTPPYGVTIYNAGTHQASGWFFYAATPKEEESGGGISGLLQTQASVFRYDAATRSILCEKPSHVVVYDMTGSMVLDSRETTNLSVAALNQGIYIARVNGQAFKFIR